MNLHIKPLQNNFPIFPMGNNICSLQKECNFPNLLYDSDIILLNEKKTITCSSICCLYLSQYLFLRNS